MTDFFAAFNVTRRPWLDPETLKTKFLALSAQTHPDRFNSASASEKESATRQFADLNAAYNCLRDPKSRLQHLLELELGAKPSDLQQIPPALADIFIEIARLTRDADDHLIKKSRVTSPLLRAQMFEQDQDLAERLMARQKALALEQELLLARVQVIDKIWLDASGDPVRRPALLDQLQEIWRLLSFFSRWSSQVNERLARLAF